MAWLTSAIALIIGSIGMINTMIMSVYERTREIGLLRAVGWSTRRVLGLILMESVLLSIVGGLLGVALGVALTKLMTQMPAVSGIIAGVINWQMIGIALAIAITIGLIGGLFPALRGARLVVTEALRHE
jgi:putative ABC transport system permease protein